METLTLNTRAAMERNRKILRDLDLAAGIIEKWSDASDARWYRSISASIEDTDRVTLRLAAKRIYSHARDIVGDSRDNVILHSIGHALVRVAEAADTVADWRAYTDGDERPEDKLEDLHNGTLDVTEHYRPALASARALITGLQGVRLW